MDLAMPVMKSFFCFKAGFDRMLVVRKHSAVRGIADPPSTTKSSNNRHERIRIGPQSRCCGPIHYVFLGVSVCACVCVCIASCETTRPAMYVHVSDTFLSSAADHGTPSWKQYSLMALASSAG